MNEFEKAQLEAALRERLSPLLGFQVGAAVFADDLHIDSVGRADGSIEHHHLPIPVLADILAAIGITASDVQTGLPPTAWDELGTQFSADPPMITLLTKMRSEVGL